MTTGDQKFCLVMELLSGRTLRNTMDVSDFETDEEIKTWMGKYLFPILEGNISRPSSSEHTR